VSTAQEQEKTGGQSVGSHIIKAWSLKGIAGARTWKNIISTWLYAVSGPQPELRYGLPRPQ